MTPQSIFALSMLPLGVGLCWLIVRADRYRVIKRRDAQFRQAWRNSSYLTVKFIEEETEQLPTDK